VTNLRTDCSTQFTIINGGNPALTPEKSVNKTLGVVLSPLPQLSVALDAFRIDVKDTISNGVPPATILGDLARYGNLVTRGPADPANPSLPGPITTIAQPTSTSARSRSAVSIWTSNTTCRWPAGD
jgi:iron complex outermembrane recepter protein